MRKIATAIFSVLALSASTGVFGLGAAHASEAEVRRMLVNKSVAEYEGACPCPYTKASDGSQCGKRSAYSKNAAEKPMCFPKDVPASMVAAYMKSEAEIRRILVQQSIDAYDGACPCPYTKTANGSECGQRSAYSKRNGSEPMCFPGDVPNDAVTAYRRSLY